MDASNGETLPGANVRIEGTNIGAATNVQGQFTLSDVPAGQHTLIASYVGFQTVRRQVDVPDGGTVEVTIEMQWQGVRGEEVTITAQAQGQTEAINQQLASNTITDVVSEARIKELPDVNAAESIGRLPGVSIQRSGGEATKVAIRGLSPKYNNVTVNGVRVPATGGGDRSVNLSLISSNMLDGIEVKKAVTPDMDADALGGTVDLRLREAPDDLSFSLSAQGGYNRLQDYYGNYKFGGSVSNRFFEDRLGIIASFNVDEYDRSADKFSAGYDQQENPQTFEQEIYVQDVGLREENIVRGRAGGSVVLDYQLPNGKIGANAFYNRLHEEGLYRINQMNIADNRHYYDYEDRSSTTSIFTGSIGLEQDFGWISYDATLARTASGAESPEDYTWRFGQEGGAFDAAPTPDLHPRDVPSTALTDSATGLISAWVWQTDREENVTTAQLNARMPFNWGDYVNGYFKAGGKLRWLDRMNDQQQTGRAGLQYGSGQSNLNPPLECVAQRLPGWNLTDVVGDEGVLPIRMVLEEYERNNFLDGRYDIGFVANLDSLRQFTNALQECTPGRTNGEYDAYRNNSIGSRGSDYSGIERYQAGYAMGEFSIGPYVTLLPGVRYERGYTRYQGQRYREVVQGWQDREPAELDSLTVTRTNDYWLPMVHLKVEPTGWLDLRLARTETLTRPDYLQYAPITTINTFNDYINAANSTLRPAHATNYDVSVSIYQNHIGLFTVSGFYKSIDDLILPTRYYLREEREGEDLPLLEGLNLAEEWSDYNAQIDTDINNSHPAQYRGIELSWQTNLWYLPSFLNGIVLNLNYTRVISEMKRDAFFLNRTDSLIRQRPPVYAREIVDSTITTRVPDQPAHVANVMLGYDYGGFSARLSFLYQTNTVAYANPTTPVLNNFSTDYTRWDLSLRQRLLDEGLELFANFNNLTARPDRTRQGGPASSNPSYEEYYGFTMDLGARYSF